MSHLGCHLYTTRGACRTCNFRTSCHRSRNVQFCCFALVLELQKRLPGQSKNLRLPHGSVHQFVTDRVCRSVPPCNVCPQNLVPHPSLLSFGSWNWT
eukprot:scaffold840_cov344-Pavlova_lutheri.AAC.85